MPLGTECAMLFTHYSTAILTVPTHLLSFSSLRMAGWTLEADEAGMQRRLKDSLHQRPTSGAGEIELEPILNGIDTEGDGWSSSIAASSKPPRLGAKHLRSNSGSAHNSWAA